MTSKARGTLQVRSSQGSGDGQIILDNSGWPSVITRVLVRGGRGVSVREGGVGKEEEARGMCSPGQGTQVASKLEEARNPFSPGAPRKDPALPAPGFLRLGHLRWTSDLHEWEIICTWV